ncbi:MAG: hypothetical protein ACXABC_03160, partial [Candidatus Thorarchaeota archaeon]
MDLDGYSDDSRIETGLWGSSWATAYAFQTGFQFPLNIPAGAAITSAYIEVEADGNQNNPNMRVYVAGRNSSGQPIEAFTTGLPHLEDRLTLVDTSVDWIISGWAANVRYTSPDIGALIQAAINEPGWSSGDYAAIMLDFMFASSYQSWNYIKGSYDTTTVNDPEDLARLYVEFIVPYSDDSVYLLQQSKDITIDSANVPSDLTNFPVLIDITDTDLKTDVQPHGDDIAFFINDVQVPHDLELFNQSYSPTHAHLVAWVLIPSLSSTVDTVIEMRYGNSVARSMENSLDVWNSDYEGVWHLNNNASGYILDSKSSNHGAPINMNGTNMVDGQIDGALDFDGDEERVLVGSLDTNAWTAI